MALNILCTPFFSKREEKELTAAAKRLGISKEEVVRAAVRFYSSSCVPTHAKVAPAKR